MTRTTATRGRALSLFLDRIMGEIGSGRYQREAFLPSTRELARLYDTSTETARRGLKLLQSQGVLTAEGRAGFRVAQPPADRSSRPVAFVTTIDPGLPQVQPTTAALFLAFQAAGTQRGWPFLSTPGGAAGTHTVASQLRGSNTWGAILDTINPELYAAVMRCGLPTVMVNSWVEDSPVSTVLQDNYRGGFLAADYLLQQGVTKVAWVGCTSEYCHTRERFAGANAALSVQNLRIADNHIVKPTAGERLEAVGRLLDREDRPKGILAFGVDTSSAVKRAADQRGLVIGRDFELVSWIVEECYDSYYRPLFEGGPPAPAVIWSAATMTDRALSLLAEVGDGSVKEPMRICVPTRLKLNGG
jgi:DNA-binding LacI/PurR family transcriptional regulator